MDPFLPLCCDNIRIVVECSSCGHFTLGLFYGPWPSPQLAWSIPSFTDLLLVPPPRRLLLLLLVAVNVHVHLTNIGRPLQQLISFLSSAV